MFVAVGAALALFVLRDAIRTTINLSERSGPIAATVLSLGRRVAQRLPRRFATTAGLAFTVGIVLSWTLGLWLAWSIALLDPAIGIVHAADQQPVGTLDRFYVAGFSIFTLGTGDLEATNTFGRLVTVVAAGTGLFTVTLEVTYLLSLTTAAAHERSTARQIYALGHDVAQVLERSWDGASFRQVEPLLQRLAGELSTLAEHHRTFPVLHDVLPSRRELALGPSLLAVSDAVDLMRFSVAAPKAISNLTYQQVTEAIGGLLAGLPPVGTGPEPPPRPEAGALLGWLDEQVDAPPDDPEADGRRAGLYQLAVEEGWQQAARQAVCAS